MEWNVISLAYGMTFEGVKDELKRVMEGKVCKMLDQLSMPYDISLDSYWNLLLIHFPLLTESLTVCFNVV